MDDLDEMGADPADPIEATGGRDGRPRGGRLRASDADRAATADLLKRHYVAGRLDAAEFEERLGRCYAARTVGQLPELVADLPREEPLPPRPRPGHRRSSALRRIGPILPILPVLALLVVVSALTGAHLLWLAWPLFFFAVGPFGRRFRGGWQRRRTGTTSG